MSTPAKKYTLEEAMQVVNQTLSNIDGMHCVRGIGSYTNMEGECKIQALLVPDSKKDLYKTF